MQSKPYDDAAVAVHPGDATLQFCLLRTWLWRHRAALIRTAHQRTRHTFAARWLRKYGADRCPQKKTISMTETIHAERPLPNIWHLLGAPSRRL